MGLIEDARKEIDTFERCSADMCERLLRRIEELECEVGFIQADGGSSVELGEHFTWALSELTRRKAYSKSEVAILIAEQRKKAEDNMQTVLQLGYMGRIK